MYSFDAERPDMEEVLINNPNTNGRTLVRQPPCRPAQKVMPCVTLPTGYECHDKPLKITFDSGAGPNAMSIIDARRRGADIKLTDMSAPTVTLAETMNHPKVTLTMRVTFDFTKFSKLFKSDQEVPGRGRGCVGRCVECFLRLRTLPFASYVLRNGPP